VYNANINLFASCAFVLESLYNGAFLPNPAITPIRLYEFIDGKGNITIAIYIIFVIFLTYRMYQASCLSLCIDFLFPAHSKTMVVMVQRFPIETKQIFLFRRQ